MRTNTIETPRLTCTLDQLATLPEETARAHALQTMDIKGHQVYFVVLDNHLGYSCLVYHSGRILPHAANHALHYPDMWRSALRQKFEYILRHRLYSDAELMTPLSSYAEYRDRLEYLVNDYGYRRPFVSVFYSKAVVAGSDEEKREQQRIESSIKGKKFNPIANGWFDDEAFVAKHCSLYSAVARRLEEMKDDFAFWLEAFMYEMANHEYAINWQGNWDVLSVFGKIKYDRQDEDQNLNYYFDQLRFTPTQRAAFYAARQEYFRRHGEDY